MKILSIRIKNLASLADELDKSKRLGLVADLNRRILAMKREQTLG